VKCVESSQEVGVVILLVMSIIQELEDGRRISGLEQDNITKHDCGAGEVGGEGRYFVWMVQGVRNM
jgi:hypothetical protein